MLIGLCVYSGAVRGEELFSEILSAAMMERTGKVFVPLLRSRNSWAIRCQYQGQLDGLVHTKGEGICKQECPDPGGKSNRRKSHRPSDQ